MPESLDIDARLEAMEREMEELSKTKVWILDFLKRLDAHLESIPEKHYPPNLRAEMLAYIAQFEELQKMIASLH